MSPPASAIMSVLSSPEGAGGRDAIDAAVAHELRARFQVERVERRGPRSRLYLGRDLDAGRPIALKVVSRAGASKQAIEAFGTAMAASVALDHPHIIPVYQYGKTRRLFWYSMKWIQGGSLHDTLRDRGPLELTTCLRLVAELAAALHHAHRHGVTHGDVKLTNVMVSADGVALLGDFAVARALRTGSWPLAPGAAADQYALAALTLECLKAGAPADMSLLVPDTVRHALARALSQDPQQRFATVLDFAAVLEKATPALSSPPPTPSPEPPAAPGAKPAVLLWDDAYEQPPVPDERHVRRVALGAALVILLAAAAAFGLWLAGRDPAPVRQVVTRPSLPSEVASVAAAPAEPAPRDTLGPPVEQPAPRPSPPPAPPAPRRPAVVLAPGRLFVGATPWGEVYVDSRLIGHTPLAALPLAAGSHQVRVVRDGFAPFVQRIEVAPGADVRLTGIVLRPFHL